MFFASFTCDFNFLSIFFYNLISIEYFTMAATSIVKKIIQPLQAAYRLSSRSSSHFTYKPDESSPNVDGEKLKMNMFTAINQAMDIALANDDSTLVFGEDVAFGGVFRCSLNLRTKYGEDRVFNTPLCEQV